MHLLSTDSELIACLAGEIDHLVAVHLSRPTRGQDDVRERYLL
jgi:hypothetical protein